MTRLFLYKELLGWIWLCGCLCPVVASDLKDRTVPQASILLMPAAAPAFGVPIKAGAAAAVSVLVIYLLLLLFSAAIKRPVPVGFGDIEVFAVLGLCLGPNRLFSLFCAASLCSGIFALWLLLTKQVQKDAELPFVPFIAIGLLFSITVVQL